MPLAGISQPVMIVRAAHSGSWGCRAERYFFSATKYKGDPASALARTRPRCERRARASRAATASCRLAPGPPPAWRSRRRGLRSGAFPPTSRTQRFDRDDADSRGIDSHPGTSLDRGSIGWSSLRVRQVGGQRDLVLAVRVHDLDTGDSPLARRRVSGTPDLPPVRQRARHAGARRSALRRAWACRPSVSLRFRPGFFPARSPSYDANGTSRPSVRTIATANRGGARGGDASSAAPAANADAIAVYGLDSSDAAPPFRNGANSRETA